MEMPHNAGRLFRLSGLTQLLVKASMAYQSQADCSSIQTS